LSDQSKVYCGSAAELQLVLVRVKKRFFLKRNPVGFLGIIGFLGFIGFFLDKQENIGKIIQKLSNLKP